MDKAHRKTDKELNKLEKELAIIYKGLSKEIQAKIKEKYVQIEKGDKPEARKQLKYIEQILLKVSIEQANLNKIAMEMLQGELERIVDINREFIYESVVDQLEEEGIDISFKTLNTDGLKEITKGDKYKKTAVTNLLNNKRIYTNLRRAMSQSYILGEGEVKRAKRIQKILGIELYEAKRIARTENTKVETLARDSVIRDAINLGSDFDKKWVTCKDKRVRDTHKKLDNEIVPYDKNFSNGCEFPGVGGSAKEVINCRCTFTPVSRRLQKRGKQ